MTLTEAIASGKRIRLGGAGEFITASNFLGGGLSVEDYNSTDYEVEAVVLVVPTSVLADAWNKAKGTSTTIASAAQSQFFSRFKQHLGTAGVRLS